MIFVDDVAQVTWACVHFTQEKLPTPQTMLSRHLRMFALDGKLLTSEEAFFSEIAVAMGFPDYFGRNWNALDECLKDLAFDEIRGFVLVVRNSDTAWRREPQLMGAFVESWLSAAEQWSSSNVSFHLLFT